MSSYANRYLLTPAKHKRRLQQRRCLGRWALYIPWILIHELSSKGWSTRAWSNKMGRVIHLLSRAEYLYFLRLELSAAVIEFYEQFALSLEITRDIAKTLHIPYPRAPYSNQDVVFTSDFLLNTADGRRVVRACKPAEGLDDERVRQKLKIEKVYWLEIQRADDWAVVTRERHNPAFDANIEWIWRMRDPNRLSNGASAHVDSARLLARHALLSEGRTIGATAEMLGREFGGRGTGTELLRHLLAIGAFPEANYCVKFTQNAQLPLIAPPK